MRKSLLFLAAPLALVATAPVVASDPTIAQVHAVAAAGHVDQALGMMDVVLKGHPGSAKAHYVEAELHSQQGDYASARTELATAERLAPGLPFANAHSKTALKQQLSGGSASGSALASRLAPSEQRSSMPWGVIAVAGLIIAGLFFLFRRRQQQAPIYPASTEGPSSYANPGYGQPGYGPQSGPWGGAPISGGGMGSGLLGGMATGAATGAGFAAGEELVDRLFGGDREGDRKRFVDQSDSQTGLGSNANSDMGGDDFGISDDSSWDDGNSGGGNDGW